MGCGVQQGELDDAAAQRRFLPGPRLYTAGTPVALFAPVVTYCALFNLHVCYTCIAHRPTCWPYPQRSAGPTRTRSVAPAAGATRTRARVPHPHLEARAVA